MKKKDPRPHKPDNGIIEFKGVESIPVDSISLEEMERKFEEGPIQWRDRILEIDAARKEEEARHCAAMAAYDDERASLVAKLKAEGFVLIQSDAANSGEESAQQDMSDWRNWKEGDSVMMLENDWTDFTVGSLYTISGIEKGGVRMNDDIENRYLTVDGETVFSDGRFPAFKWHSRPTN